MTNESLYEKEQVIRDPTNREILTRFSTATARDLAERIYAPLVEAHPSLQHHLTQARTQPIDPITVIDSTAHTTLQFQNIKKAYGDVSEMKSALRIPSRPTFSLSSGSLTMSLGSKREVYNKAILAMCDVVDKYLSARAEFDPARIDFLYRSLHAINALSREKGVSIEDIVQNEELSDEHSLLIYPSKEDANLFHLKHRLVTSYEGVALKGLIALAINQPGAPDHLLDVFEGLPSIEATYAVSEAEKKLFLDQCRRIYS